MGSVDECLEFGLLLEDQGVTHVAFIIETEDCQLFSTWEQKCTALGGPESAPSSCTES